MSEPEFPEEIYWVTGGARSKLYGSKKSVRLALPNRRRGGSLRSVQIWKQTPLGWADHTEEFIDEIGRLIWRIH